MNMPNEWYLKLWIEIIEFLKTVDDSQLQQYNYLIKLFIARFEQNFRPPPERLWISEQSITKGSTSRWEAWKSSEWKRLQPMCFKQKSKQKLHIY